MELDENEKYELRVIMSVNYISDIKYNSNVFSRHGGSFKHWWLQKKVDKKQSLPIQLENEIELNSDSFITVVYIRSQNNDNLQKMSSKLLHYIGGQTHITCQKHKMPLIPIADRKLKCSCGRNEHFH